MSDARYGMGTGRIRTVKPELFQHELLYDLEQETGAPVRLAFVGLFTQSDREGRFPWRPRTLKARILPYDTCDFRRVLDACATRGLLVHYRSEDGQEWGCIPSFPRHQHINPREKESIIPAPENCEIIQGVDACPTRAARDEDASPTEGNGREGKGSNSLSPQAPTDPIPELEQQVIAGVNDALNLSGAAKLKASRHLRQRLRDGATVQECLDVYLWAADTWGKVRGTPSAQYVRPSTLYGKEKFPGYARSAQQWRGGGDAPKPTPTKRRHVRDRRPEITDEEIATLHASGYCDAEGYQ